MQDDKKTDINSRTLPQSNNMTKYLISLSIFGGFDALESAMYASTVLLLKYVRADGQCLLVNAAAEIAKKGTINPELVPYLSKAFTDSVSLRESTALLATALFGSAAVFGSMHSIFTHSSTLIITPLPLTYSTTIALIPPQIPNLFTQFYRLSLSRLWNTTTQDQITNNALLWNFVTLLNGVL
jgi:hypothetical protein